MTEERAGPVDDPIPPEPEAEVDLYAGLGFASRPGDAPPPPDSSLPPDARVASEGSVRTLSRRLADYTHHIEKLNIGEYVALVRDPRRMFFLNLLSGIGRGFGIAIGFTILGAIFLTLLQRLVMLNLPGIGGFIAEIVRMVQTNLNTP